MGKFFLCSIIDGEGKRHRIFMPKWRGLIKGWALLAEKLRELGIRGKIYVCLRGNEIKEACVKEARVAEGDEEGRVIKGVSFVEVTRCERKSKTIWIDVGDCMSKNTLGALMFCLVGRILLIPSCR